MSIQTNSTVVFTQTNESNRINQLRSSESSNILEEGRKVKDLAVETLLDDSRNNNNFNPTLSSIKLVSSEAKQLDDTTLSNLLLNKSSRVIRSAAKADSVGIATLHIESLRATYRGILSDNFLDVLVENDRLSFWQTQLESPPSNQLVLIAHEEDKYLGFICTRLKADNQWGTAIDNLHVHPNKKGKGIGTQLMEKAAEWIFSQAPDDGIWLWSFQKNEAACNYYKGLGGIEAEICLRQTRAENSVMSVRYVWKNPDQLRQLIVKKREMSKEMGFVV